LPNTIHRVEKARGSHRRDRFTRVDPERKKSKGEIGKIRKSKKEHLGVHKRISHRGTRPILKKGRINQPDGVFVLFWGMPDRGRIAANICHRGLLHQAGLLILLVNEGRKMSCGRSRAKFRRGGVGYGPDGKEHTMGESYCSRRSRKGGESEGTDWRSESFTANGNNRCKPTLPTKTHHSRRLGGGENRRRPSTPGEIHCWDCSHGQRCLCRRGSSLIRLEIAPRSTHHQKIGWQVLIKGVDRRRSDKSKRKRGNKKNPHWVDSRFSGCSFKDAAWTGGGGMVYLSGWGKRGRGTQ